MGFARKFFISLICVVLVLSLIATNILLTVSLSLKEESAKPQFNSFAKEIINSQPDIRNKIDQNIIYAKYDCKNKTFYNFSQEGIQVDIPCSVINNGTDAVIDYAVENSFDEIYYKNYSCEMWQCAKENSGGIPTVLVSEKARDYWKNKFFIALSISALLCLAVILLTIKKSNALIKLGIVFLLSALPLLSIKGILSTLPDSILSKAVSAFFTKANLVFWIILVISIFLIIIGVALKIAGIMSNSEKEEPVKKKKSK